MKLVPYFYLSAIRSALPDITDLRCPNVPGTLNTTFVASTPRGEFVCKFNHRDMANKNAKFSRLMARAGVAVPQSTVHKYNGCWFEVYPMIPGKTLFECIENNEKNLNVMDVYEDVVKQFVKMTSVPVALIDDVKFKNIHQVTYRNVADMTNPIVAPVFAGIVRAMNVGRGHTGLYHCGITPKNIIVSDTNKFAGLVDLDDIAVAKRDYAFGVMATQYANLGYRANDLIDMYEQITFPNHDANVSVLNNKAINRIGRTNDIGRWFMWQAKKNRTK